MQGGVGIGAFIERYANVDNATSIIEEVGCAVVWIGHSSELTTGIEAHTVRNGAPIQA